MISMEKVQEILRSKGVALEKIASDPHVYDKACGIAYKAMPIPLRWFVGKKRMRKLVTLLQENLIKNKRR